jgi:hypothetical protein
MPDLRLIPDLASSLGVAGSASLETGPCQLVASARTTASWLCTGWSGAGALTPGPPTQLVPERHRWFLL